MVSITIRNLDEELKARLRVRAARRGRSMKEEARDILRSALSERTPGCRDLATAIQERFAKFGGIELPLIDGDPPREPPELG